MLHPCVGCDDEESRQPRAREHRESREPVQLRSQSLFAENQQSQKSRFEEKRKDAFHRQGLSQHSARCFRELSPICAELKFHGNASDDAHGEINGKDFHPETRRLVVSLIATPERDGLQDQDYIDRYTIGFDALKRRVEEYPPSRVSEITGVSETTIERFTREYATHSPGFIRVNYGLQRHAGGGMAVRNIFCLPALIGSWRYPGGGAVLSTSGFFKYNYAALERADLIQGRPRTINMSRLGEALTNANPPVRAIVVYNTNPGAIAPNQQRVLEGFKRDDLFTVVLEHFQTDTADYADILLPATTQLEHLDIHRAYGHTYAMLNTPAIRPLGESKPNTEIFRLLAKHMGFDDRCFQDSDEDLVRQSLAGVSGVTLDELRRKGWVSLRIGDAPFAEGNFPTPSGKCEFYSERLKDLDPLPTYIPPREDRLSNPPLAQEFPLVLISPPAHHFLNSTFVNLFQEKELGPTLEINATDAAARHIADGSPVQIFNNRGSFLARAVVTDRTRSGVVCAPSIWWNKLVPGGRNANSTTSEEVIDLGGGATFYDNLVDVRSAD